MSEEATLVQKFTVFFNEVLPLFGVKEVNQAEADLAEPKNIHTFLYFLQSPDNRALIVNIKTGDNGSKRFYFYLNPRDVGNVESGFTLIKKSDFDINRRFKNVFHALSLEPFLVTRIDALLFDELLQTMAPSLTTVRELEPIFTFGQDEPILDSKKNSRQEVKPELSPSQSDKYISIQEPEDSLYRSSEKGPSPLKPAPSPRLTGKSETKPPIFSKNGKFANRLNSKDGLEEDDVQLKYKPNLEKKPSDRSTPSRKQEPEVGSPTKRGNSPMRKSVGGSITKLTERGSTPKKIIGNGDLSSPTKVDGNNKVSSVKNPTDSPTDPGRKLAENSSSTRTSGLRTSQIYNSNKDEQPPAFGNGMVGTSNYASQPSTAGKKKKKQIYVLESLDAAREGIRQNKSSVAELATYHVPTRTMELVMQAVILLTSGKKLPWPKIKLEIKKPTWLKEVLDLGTNDVDPSVVNEIMHNYLIDDDWEPTGPGTSKSSKTKSFAEWVETFCCEVKKEQAAHGVE